MFTAGKVTPILRGALLGALAAVLLLAEPAPGSAQSDPDPEPASGAGTTWLACRDQAWADYNTCLVERDSFFGHVVCFFAWDLDNVSCDAALLRNLMF